MTIVQEKLKKIVDEHLGPLLKHHGFKKSEKTFVKFSPPYWLVVNVQSSMWNSASTGKFTVNIARHDTRYDEEPQSKPPKYYEAKPFMPVRIGELISGEDKWWVLDKHTDANEVGRELAMIIANKALPCLSEWGTDKAVHWNLSIPETELIAT